MSNQEVLTEISHAQGKSILRCAVETILDHLGAAKGQTLPSDDQIIAGHVIAAHAVALSLLRAIQRTDM